jgi:hypothetical protein
MHIVWWLVSGWQGVALKMRVGVIRGGMRDMISLSFPSAYLSLSTIRSTTHKCLCWEHKSLYYKPFLLLHGPDTTPQGLVIGVQKPCRCHAETRITEISDSVTVVAPATRNCSKVGGWLVVLMRGRDFNPLHLHRF